MNLLHLLVGDENSYGYPVLSKVNIEPKILWSPKIQIGKITLLAKPFCVIFFFYDL